MMPRSPEDFHNYVAQELRAGDRRMDEIVETIARIQAEQAAIRSDIAAYKQSTDAVAENTKEMLAVFESWKGAMKVLEMIGKLAKPLVGIVGLLASFAAIWASIKSGVTPK